MGEPLDDPVGQSLRGSHQHFAVTNGSAQRYRADVTVFASVENHQNPECFVALSALVAPGDTVAVVGGGVGETPGFTVLFSGLGHQLVGNGVEGMKDRHVEPLGQGHVPQMLDLVARTEPGPFERRTHEMGRYFGFFFDGQLIAMAGQRMFPHVGHELSAVCTDPAFMRQGLAERLIRHLVALDHDQGLTAFLHVAATNTGAQKLYERLGFTHRRDVEFTRLERVNSN